MIKDFRIVPFILLLISAGFFYKTIYIKGRVSYLSYIFTENQSHKAMHEKVTNDKGDTTQEYTGTTESNINDHMLSNGVTPEDILSHGNGIIFLETTNRMKPPSLVLCAVESAARVYPDRPVTFFMKGVTEIKSVDDEKKVLRLFPTLSSLDNVYIFPLIMEDIFNSTPLLPWYKKVNPEQEQHWIHVSSDGCRLALIWKHGGIYMDTDIISIRAIPDQNFLAAQSSHYSSNGVFGFSSHHYFTWKSMEDFAQNYNGRIWGHQGPQLFTRVLQKFCTLPEFKGVEDIMCGNICFLNPQHFYPIPYPAWRRYFEVWDKLPTFNDSYALHLWNYMNNEHRTMKPGSNTLVENLYKTHCPSTYLALKKNESTYLE